MVQLAVCMRQGKCHWYDLSMLCQWNQVLITNNLIEKRVNSVAQVIQCHLLSGFEYLSQQMY